MARWVAQIDDLDDVVVPGKVAEFVTSRFSKATCFQHFAYSGYRKEDFLKGKMVPEKYQGYCWDSDQYHTWYEEIADITWMDVQYDTHCGVFTPDVLAKSPGAAQINGHTDWDDQIYPSALDLAEFYGKIASEMSIDEKDKKWGVQSLCFAAHLLQDLGVPHHVLNTVANGHSRFEETMYGLWRNYYAGRSAETKHDELVRKLSAMVVKRLTDSSLAKATSFRKLGEWAVNRTGELLETTGGIPNNLCILDAVNLTLQGTVCTMRALSLHLK